MAGKQPILGSSTSLNTATTATLCCCRSSECNTPEAYAWHEKHPQFYTKLHDDTLAEVKAEAKSRKDAAGQTLASSAASLGSCGLTCQCTADGHQPDDSDEELAEAPAKPAPKRQRRAPAQPAADSAHVTVTVDVQDDLQDTDHDDVLAGLLEKTAELEQSAHLLPSSRCSMLLLCADTVTPRDGHVCLDLSGQGPWS